LSRFAPSEVAVELLGAAAAVCGIANVPVVTTTPTAAAATRCVHRRGSPASRFGSTLAESEPRRDVRSIRCRLERDPSSC
jgi:hypothetical protein